MEDRWEHLKDHRCKAALQEIKDDIENVRAAWRDWLEERNAAELRKFFKSLWMAHETWGWFRPAIDLFREAATSLSAGESELASGRAFALAVEGWFTSLVGSPDEGIVMARESFEVLRHLGEDMFRPSPSSLRTREIWRRPSSCSQWFSTIRPGNKTRLAGGRV